MKPKNGWVWIAVAGALIGLIGAGWLLSGGEANQSTAPNSPNSGQIAPNPDEKTTASVSREPSKHQLGSPTSSLIITEAVDLGCPACAHYHKILKPIVSDYSDQIIFELRHYPLTWTDPDTGIIHQTKQNSDIAHQAAEAAGNQNQFWSMVDLIFSNQTTWSQQSASLAQTTMEGFAQELGLNVDRFKTDMKSPQTAATIRADQTWVEARGGGLGTPAFFVNGEFIPHQTIQPDDQSLRNLLDGLLTDQP